MLSGVAFAVACHDWDRELAHVLTRLDAQSDGGVDGGPHDAGCRAPLCLRRAFEIGDLVRDLTPLPSGAFMATGTNRISPSFVAVVFDGGLTSTALPKDFREPWGVAGTGLDDYLVAGAFDGVVIHRNGQTEVYRVCNLPRFNVFWAAASALAGGEAVLGGDESAVCIVSPQGGVTGLDLRSVSSPGEAVSITDALTFDTGERFMAGGGLIYWKPPGTAMISRIPSGEDAGKSAFALSGHAPDSVWGLGGEGFMVRWEPNPVDGGTWKEAPAIPFAFNAPQALWVVGNDDVWVVGLDGFIKHFDGSAWKNVAAENVGEETYLLAVAATGSHDLMLAGSQPLPDGGYTGMLLYYERGPRP